MNSKQRGYYAGGCWEMVFFLGVVAILVAIIPWLAPYVKAAWPIMEPIISAHWQVMLVLVGLFFLGLGVWGRKREG